MSESPEPESPTREADRLIYAGLLGLGAAAIVQMLDKGNELTVSLLIAVYAFALALPLQAVGLITDYARRAGTHVPPWRDLLGFVGIIAGVVGLGALFFHFALGVGIVFAVGCVVGVILIRIL